jgi:hypothetical protein
MSHPSLRNYIKQHTRQHTVALIIGAYGKNFTKKRAAGGIHATEKL